MKKYFLLVLFLLLSISLVSADHVEEIDFEAKAYSIADDFVTLLDESVEDTINLANNDYSNLEVIRELILDLDENNQVLIWYNIGSDEVQIERRETISKYSEITFIDVNGMEVLKYSNEEFQDDLFDVSNPENTEFLSETYYEDTKDLDQGEVLIGKVMAWYTSKEEVFTDVSEEDVGNYDFVIGRDTMKEGVVRFSTPVYEGNTFYGVLVLSLDYRVLQGLSKHVDPIESDLVVSTTYSGNYLLVFDIDGNTITHPKPDNIRGYLEDGELAGYNEPDSTREGNIFNLYRYQKSQSYREMATKTLEQFETYTASATDVGGRSKLTITVPILYSNEKTNYADLGVWGGIMMSIELEPDEEEVVEDENRIYLYIIIAIFILFLLVYLIIEKFGIFRAKLTRKMTLQFFIIATLPLIIIFLVVFLSQNNIYDNLTESIDNNLVPRFHDAADIDLIFLSNSIEQAIIEYEHNFNLMFVNQDFYDLLLEADATGIVEGENFYPEPKTETWYTIQNRFLEMYSYADEEVDMIRLFHENGFIVNGIIFGEEDSDDYKGDKSWFQDTLNPSLVETNETYISPISIARRTNSPAIRYSRPVENNGSRLGLFVVNFKSDAITNLVETFEYGENGYAALVDYSYENAEGEISDWPVILSRSTGEDFYYINESESEKFFLEKSDLVEGNTHFDIDFEDVEYHVHYLKVDVEDKDWYLFLISPESEAFSMLVDLETSTDESFRNNLILMGVIVIFTILASIALGLFFSSRVANPIKKLHEVVLRIKEKDFKARVEINTKDELKDLGDTLNQTAEALDHVEEEYKKLEKAKTEFISITSHELRSPMTPMRAQLQMLLGGYYGKLNAKQKKAMNIVVNNTSRLDNLIVDFLEVSRIEAARLKFNFVKTDLTNSINSILEEMKNFMPEKNISLVKKISKLPVIEVDPDRVGQVLRNLVNNAIKFTPENGKVEVVVDALDNKLFFSVKDTGVGISKENQEKIFEPFFQATNMYQHKSGGTGLGLAIVRGIVESQGGRIWVEGEVGKGSKFSFTIPFKPVKKIKPIRLLFSPKVSYEGKVMVLFNEYLGPIGEKEFERLKQQEGVSKGSIFSYISMLKKRKVLEDEKIKEFRKDILNIFGKEVKVSTQYLKEKGFIKKDKKKTKKKKRILKKSKNLKRK